MSFTKTVLDATHNPIMSLTNLQKKIWYNQLGLEILFSNGVVIDPFDNNKIISLYSMKHMFDNDLKVVQ